MDLHVEWSILSTKLLVLLQLLSKLACYNLLEPFMSAYPDNNLREMMVLRGVNDLLPAGDRNHYKLWVCWMHLTMISFSSAFLEVLASLALFELDPFLRDWWHSVCDRQAPHLCLLLEVKCGSILEPILFTSINVVPESATLVCSITRMLLMQVWSRFYLLNSVAIKMLTTNLN